MFCNYVWISDMFNIYTETIFCLSNVYAVMMSVLCMSNVYSAMMSISLMSMHKLCLYV